MIMIRIDTVQLVCPDLLIGGLIHRHTVEDLELASLLFGLCLAIELPSDL